MTGTLHSSFPTSSLRRGLLCPFMPQKNTFPYESRGIAFLSNRLAGLCLSVVCWCLLFVVCYCFC